MTSTVYSTFNLKSYDRLCLLRPFRQQFHFLHVITICKPPIRSRHMTTPFAFVHRSPTCSTSCRFRSFVFSHTLHKRSRGFPLPLYCTVFNCPYSCRTTPAFLLMTLPNNCTPGPSSFPGCFTWRLDRSPSSVAPLHTVSQTHLGQQNRRQSEEATLQTVDNDNFVVTYENSVPSAHFDYQNTNTEFSFRSVFSSATQRVSPSCPHYNMLISVPIFSLFSTATRRSSFHFLSSSAQTTTRTHATHPPSRCIPYRRRSPHQLALSAFCFGNTELTWLSNSTDVNLQCNSPSHSPSTNHTDKASTTLASTFTSRLLLTANYMSRFHVQRLAEISNSFSPTIPIARRQKMLYIVKYYSTENVVLI
jgi:hypothetical protein